MFSRVYGFERCLRRRHGTYVPHIDCHNLWQLLLRDQVKCVGFVNQHLYYKPHATQVVEQCNAHMLLHGLRKDMYAVVVELEHLGIGGTCC